MAEQKNQQQDVNQLLKVRYEKLHELQENGKDPFRITKYDVTHHSREIKDRFEALEGQEVSVAGRMMFKRVMGKASFCNVQDVQGSIQAYVARDEVGEDSYKDFKKYDAGDIMGIRGRVFKTKTGEISIHAKEITLLSKSLQILPEKFHGLTDTEIPPAVCGPDHERGSKGDVSEAFQGNQQHPPLSGRTGFYRGGDADAGGECGRCGGASF